MSNLCRFGRWNDAQFVDWDCQWYSFQIPKDPPWGPSNQPARGGDREAPIVPGAPTGSWVDYGRKPYLSRSHYEMMRRTPLRAAFDKILQKKSQFEKPYLDDEYSEMQHWLPAPPQVPSWGDEGPTEGPPGPGPTLPPEDSGPAETPEGRIKACGITCSGDIGRCDNDECGPQVFGSCTAEWTTINTGGTWSVTGSPYKKFITGRNNPKFKNHPTGLDSIEIYPDWGQIEVSGTSLWGYYKWKKAVFQVHYTDYHGYTCTEELTVSCCTIIDCDCPSVPTFAYSDGNPATIGQGNGGYATATITVDNGCANFSWSVSGTGFSFANATTETGTNTLQADDTACGVASITVTDNCATDVTGEVRCTADSDWVYKSRSSATCSPYVGVSGEDTYDIIVGGTKWQMVGSPTYSTFECCSAANSNCVWSLTSPAVAPPCGNPCECCVDQGCTRCGGISNTHWPAFDYYLWECV